MKGKKRDRTDMNSYIIDLVCASISFPSDVYKMLEPLAKSKKVSLPWAFLQAQA